MFPSRILGAVAALAVGSSIHASMIGPIFTIQASNAQGSTTMGLDASLFQFQSTRSNDTQRWVLTEPVEITNGSGQTLGTLTNASFLLVGAQSVSESFAVTAGGSDTMFSFATALLSFPTIDPAEATASAGISFTDNDGDGVALTGGNSTGHFFRAGYNGGIAGTIYADLLSPLSDGPFGTDTENDSTGPFALVGVGVSDIQTQFKFTVSANDSAAGTGVFAVEPFVPSPGAGMLVLAGFAAAGRRRR